MIPGIIHYMDPVDYNGSGAYHNFAYYSPGLGLEKILGLLV